MNSPTISDVERQARELWAREYELEANGFANAKARDIRNGNLEAADVRAISAIAKVITALSSQKSEREEWQDISTAPKDGSPILISEIGWVMIGCWETHHGRSGWAVGSDDGAPEDCYTIWAEPDHWRPLPDPPAIRNLKIEVGHGG